MHLHFKKPGTTGFKHNSHPITLTRLWWALTKPSKTLSLTFLKPRDLIRDNSTVYVDSPGDYSKWCQG